MDIQMVCRFIQDKEVAGGEGEQTHFNFGLFAAAQSPDGLGRMFAGDAAEGKMLPYLLHRHVRAGI